MKDIEKVVLVAYVARENEKYCAVPIALVC